MKYVFVLLLMFSFVSKAETKIQSLANAHFLSEMCLLEIKFRKYNGLCDKFRTLNIDVKHLQKEAYNGFKEKRISKNQLSYYLVVLYRIELNRKGIERHYI